jgi:hypothetical protein
MTSPGRSLCALTVTLGLTMHQGGKGDQDQKRTGATTEPVHGSLEYQIDGQPTKVYHAGEALTVPAGVVHPVRNVGTGTTTELATYVVEKGKPLLTVAR